jgi:hypothetical protein
MVRVYLSFVSEPVVQMSGTVAGWFSFRRYESLALSPKLRLWMKTCNVRNSILNSEYHKFSIIHDPNETNISHRFLAEISTEALERPQIFLDMGCAKALPE